MTFHRFRITHLRAEKRNPEVQSSHDEQAGEQDEKSGSEFFENVTGFQADDAAQQRGGEHQRKGSKPEKRHV